MVTMETILPEQLSPAIRKLVLPALKSLAKAQWQIYRINLSAESPGIVDHTT
jgi:hypothetical protein